ncbi:MAG: exodeoxyribonuclease VII large subunit [Bacteroidales bacterium]|nr:exodeoxyribonuclease VII large subunit [Bacteroidales bacterium]
MTLYELNHQVARALTRSFPSPIWVQAEISELRQAANGHCYMELIEKAENTGQLVAKARAMIWANKWYALSNLFEQTTGQRLSNGLKVLVEVQVQMHEAFGYSLVIHNIDPSFTLGEMERRKREIIQRLTEEGMIDMNRSLPFPTLPQRIAVISAEGAAGYGDFCHQLTNNEWGMHFYIKLFPAAMQGDQTEASVIHALDRIAQYQELFDVVVIIRGGGSVSDLSAFDSYALGANIANFPLPVITGIGHERDHSVCDVVAHTSVKTPTAAAALLIDTLCEQMSKLLDLEQRLINANESRMEREKMRLERLTNGVRNTHIILQQQIGRLDIMLERISMNARQRVASEQQRLSYMERTVQMAQPDNILKRGFSIARYNGHAIKNAKDVPIGAEIEIETSKGKIAAKKI